MAYPGGWQAVKVGVLLARQPDDLGEWLADGAAFEAAGADALWVDFAPAATLDPLALTAALAGVTSRSLLVTNLPASDRPSQALGRMLATIGQLSHGRLRILTDGVQLGELAKIGPGLRVVRRIPGGFETFEHTRGPVERAPDEAQRWVFAPSPDSRATWRATVLDAAERGFRGLLVPADPRLLDILRNPDDPDQRRDLQLAQG